MRLEKRKRTLPAIVIDHMELAPAETQTMHRIVVLEAMQASLKQNMR